MNKFLLFLSLFFLKTTLPANAQDDTPTLKGNINISVTKGTMECDFILQHTPRSIADNYVIRINSGMNIHSFKNLKNGNLIYYDTDSKDTLSSGETIAYFIPGNNNKGRFLPEDMEIKYTGMYPIADSAKGYSVHDWRGNVAFNGYSVRADGYQSGWYPMLYDVKKQHLYEKVKYDLNITCSDCTTLFVNGSKPVKATTAHFVSNVPHPLTMYCGRFDVNNINGTWLLNPDMDKTQQKQFLNIINADKQYYEKNLGINYKDDITFIQTTSVAPPDHAFLFVSYPTITNVGVGDFGLHAMFDKTKGDYYKPYLAHELGHYYFGTYLRTNTGFGPVIEEGFAEYLSCKATKALYPDSVYQKLIKKKFNLLKNFKANPLATVKNAGDLGDRELYVYNYVPVLLTAIEKEAGEQAMWAWMKTMLNTPTDFTDYAFFESTFESSMPYKAKAAQIKAKYFTSADALTTAVSTIGEK